MAKLVPPAPAAWLNTTFGLFRLATVLPAKSVPPPITEVLLRFSEAASTAFDDPLRSTLTCVEPARLLVRPPPIYTFRLALKLPPAFKLILLACRVISVISF